MKPFSYGTCYNDKTPNQCLDIQCITAYRYLTIWNKFLNKSYTQLKFYRVTCYLNWWESSMMLISLRVMILCIADIHGWSIEISRTWKILPFLMLIYTTCYWVKGNFHKLRCFTIICCNRVLIYIFYALMFSKCACHMLISA